MCYVGDYVGVSNGPRWTLAEAVSGMSRPVLHSPALGSAEIFHLDTVPSLPEQRSLHYNFELHHWPAWNILL